MKKKIVNINGRTDTSYVYGADRLSLDRFDESTGYYLYEPRGIVTGITNEEGRSLWDIKEPLALNRNRKD